MGETSIVVNDFMRDKRRFADAFNGFCFGGERVIKPEDLEEGSEQYAQETKGGDGAEVTERFRDVKMCLKSGGMLRILAIENQSYVDYTMPFRCMEYDCLEYGRQLRELKAENKHCKRLKEPAEVLSGILRTDRLIPMLTICIYHGEEVWNGPRTLGEMMDFGEGTEGLRDLFSEYSMRLFCINEYDDFDMFCTELREVFAVLNYRSDKLGMLKLMEENEAYHHLDRESVRTLSVLLKNPRIWEEREKYMSKNEDKEEFDMCLALRELEEDARAEGFALASQIFVTIQKNHTMPDEIIADKCHCTVAEVQAIRKVIEV